MNFHGRMINIRDNADDEALSEYKRGHRDARHAAAEIANEADARIAELEAQLAAAQAENKQLRDAVRSVRDDLIYAYKELFTVECFIDVAKQNLDKLPLINEGERNGAITSRTYRLNPETGEVTISEQAKGER